MRSQTLFRLGIALAIIASATCYLQPAIAKASANQTRNQSMKFGYTIIYVKDLQKTVEFYERVFGVKRNFIHESGYAEMITGETKLAFASFELAKSHAGKFEASELAKLPLGFEIDFVTDTPEEDFAKAVAEGATPVSKPEKKPWGQTVSYVRDLNGVLVEICSPAKP